MTRINSKTKGNIFERYVAKLLTNEFAEFTQDKFGRVPNSGALMGGINAKLNSTLSNSAKRSLTGDIIVPDNFKYFIEAKSYSEINIYNLLTKTNYKHKIYRWIDECLDAENSGYDGWIIIAKQNRKDILMLMHENIFNNIIKTNPERIANITYKNMKYILISYKDLFSNCDKSRFFSN